MPSDNKATLNGHSQNTNYSESYAELSKIQFLAGESETKKRETDKRLLTLILHEVEKKGEFKHPKYVAYTKKKKEILREAERQKAEKSKDLKLTTSIANISNVTSSGIVFLISSVALNPFLALACTGINFAVVKKIAESMATNGKDNKSRSKISFAALLVLSLSHTLMAGATTSTLFGKQGLAEVHAQQILLSRALENVKIAEEEVSKNREELRAFSNSKNRTNSSKVTYQLAKDIFITKEITEAIEQNISSNQGSSGNPSGKPLNNAVQQHQQIFQDILEGQIQSIPDSIDLLEKQEEQLLNLQLAMGTSQTPTALDYLRLNQQEIFNRNFITTKCSEEQKEDSKDSPQCYEISSGLTAVNLAMSDLSGSLGTIPKALWQQDSALLKQVLHQNFLQLCVMFIVGTISLVAVLKLRTQTSSKDVRNNSDEVIDVKSEAAS